MQREKGGKQAEKPNERLNAPEDRDQARREAQEDAAMWPGSGAPVHRARVGAELASEDPMSQQGETADALKRAVGNDGRP